MHELLMKRTVHERIFKRLQKTINTLLSDESASPRILEKRQKEFADRWMILQEAHDMYILSCFSNADEIVEQDCFLEPLAAEFYATEIKCERFIVEDNKATSIQKTSENAIKIERFKFPIFDGHIRKYAKFKYEFNKFVKPLCSENQLTFVLKNYLCESVRRDVENLDHDVNLMWNRLDEKYGEKQKLIDSIIHEIKRLPEISNNPEGLLMMISTIEAANNDLRCVNSEEELNNSTIMSMIEQRMSTQMHDEWVKLVIKTPKPEKFETLLSFLQNWKIRIEYRNADIRLPDRQSTHSDQNTGIVLPPMKSAYPNQINDNGFPYGQPPNATTRTCLIHSNCEHPIWRCRKFLSLPVSERLKIVLSCNACTLCLERGHDDTSCYRVSQCSRNNCNQRHNVLLHNENS